MMNEAYVVLQMNVSMQSISVCYSPPFLKYSLLACFSSRSPFFSPLFFGIGWTFYVTWITLHPTLETRTIFLHTYATTMQLPPSPTNPSSTAAAVASSAKAALVELEESSSSSQ
jgi:hypothetical protein